MGKDNINDHTSNSAGSSESFFDTYDNDGLRPDEENGLDYGSAPGGAGGSGGGMVRRLSANSRKLDRGNKGYLDKIELAVRKVDKNGDGVFDINEIFEIVESLALERKRKYCLKSALGWALGGVIMLLFGVAGLMYMVLDMSKEVSPDGDANLVDYNSGKLLATHSHGVKLAVDVDLSAAFSERRNRRLLETCDSSESGGGPTFSGNIPRESFERQWDDIVDGAQTHLLFKSGAVERTVLLGGTDLQETQLDGMTRYTGLREPGRSPNPNTPTTYYHLYCDNSDDICAVYKTIAPTVVVSSVEVNGAVFVFRTDFPNSEVQVQVSSDPFFDDDKAFRFSNLINTTVQSDCTGYVTVNGLRAETQYYYRLMVDGVETKPDYIQTFKTYPRTTSTSPFSFVVLADAMASRGHSTIPTYKNAGSEDALFALQIGDFERRAPETLSEYRLMHRSIRDPHYEQGKQLVENVLSKMSFYHIWNDNDYCGANSGDSCHPQRKADAIQAFKEYYPSYAYSKSESQSDSNYYSFHVGNAEFLMLDIRSQRVDNLRRDDSSKTMLGDAQKQWLKNALLSSGATWKFIISPVTANKAARPQDPNHWASFLYEANSLSKFLETLGLNDGSVIMITGDLHSGGAIDRGCNNFFGLPELSVAPSNFIGSDEEDLGTWNEGGVDAGNPGYAVVLVDNDQLLIKTKRSDGTEINRLYIDLNNFERKCSNGSGARVREL